MKKDPPVSWSNIWVSLHLPLPDFPSKKISPVFEKLKLIFLSASIWLESLNL